MGSTIRSASLVDYPEVARSSGLDPYKMLERVGLPGSCLRNPDLRISADAVAELLEASASAARAEDFALRLAQRRGLSNLGPLALIVREQPTVRKEGYDGIVCKAADLDKAIPASDPVMARYLKDYFDSILPSARAEVCETVRELMWVMLESGSCSAERVAKHLGVDRRTINRRLASEGQSYSSILDAVRRDMVTSSVEHGQRPLNEIAGMLDFSGLSAFSRWFRNRFGRSASDWRAANLEDTHR